MNTGTDASQRAAGEAPALAPAQAWDPAATNPAVAPRIPLVNRDGTLTPDAKRRSLLTGMWAMPLMGLGFTCALLPAFIFVVLVAEAMGDGARGSSGLAALMAAVVGGLIAGFIGLIAMMIVPWFGILPLFAGASAFFGGLLGSIRALRTLGVASPRAVTWRASLVGYAIALGGTNVVAAVVGFVIAQLRSGGEAQMAYAFTPQLHPLAAIVYYLLNVVGLISIGAVAWPLAVRRTERKAWAL